jgi:hypothetical protein
MKVVLKVICLIVLLIANVVAAIFLSFMAWLYCDWMIDDSMVTTMTTIDWAFIACERLFWAMALAAVVGIVLGVINRVVYSLFFPERKRPHWLLSGIAGICIAIAGIIGSVEFFIEKPYM